jgi:predicted ArsR family transcriptional regulator
MTGSGDFTRDVAGIGALADEVRRELYLFVSGQQQPVSRDQAAAELGLPRHQAKFHLDRLEAAGLLESDYVRLTGRTGPGAGRPAKVYRRTSQDIAVSLPGREYALAGELMAEAITAATRDGVPVQQALEQVARARGRSIGAGASGQGSPLELAREALARFGYEPRDEDGRLVMANCPFHALAESHTELVCQMNDALLGGVCERIGGLHADLEPAEDRCCVVISSAR